MDGFSIISLVSVSPYLSLCCCTDRHIQSDRGDENCLSLCVCDIKDPSEERNSDVVDVSDVVGVLRSRFFSKGFLVDPVLIRSSPVWFWKCFAELRDLFSYIF